MLTITKVKAMSANQLTRLSAAALCALLLAGCATEQNPKQTMGGVLGAVGGAVLGAQMGKGKGQLVTVAIGTLAGAMIGSEIGRDMDEADRRRASNATQSTLENSQTGETSRWSNPDSGNYGTVTPTRTYESSDYRPCREYTTTIVINGREEDAVGEACRDPDGTWRIVN